MRKWTGIMAADSNGVIGKEGRLPWSYHEDLKFFQDTTDGAVMLMGSKTHESLPPLVKRNRLSVVVTRRVSSVVYSQEGLIFVPTLDALATLNFDEKRCYMIGGGVLLGLCLDRGLIDKFILTLMHQEYHGDAYMPLERLSAWRKTRVASFPDYDRFVLEQM